MKPRMAVTLSLVACVLLAAPAFTGGAAGADAASRASGDRAALAASFPHARHVSRAWLQGEVARDCRTCHRWGEDAVEPADGCTVCHYDRQEDGAATLAVRGTAGAIPRAIPIFRHEDHLPDGMTCATCHRDPAAPATVLPDDMWVPSGLGWCERCHDPAASEADARWNPIATAPAAQRAFKAALDAAPQMAADAGARFSHADHLRGDEAAAFRAGDCAGCHDGLAAAGPRIGEALFEPEACTRCHVGVEGTRPAAVTARVVPEPASLAMLTFRHDDHLGPRALERSERLRDEGCLACHDSRPGAALETDRFPLKTGVAAFSSCVGCHAEAGMTGPLATALPDHGQVESCVGCHAVGADDRDMKTNRPRREVERLRGGVYAMDRIAHPHVTGAVIDGGCARCHVASRESLLSDIVGRPFSHDPHLPDDGVTDADCLACHVPSEADGTMETRRDGEPAALHRREVCAGCHRRPDAASPQVRDARAVREVVPVFSHADHLKPPREGREALTCASCHVAADSAVPHDAWTEAAEVVACTACHDHDANADVTAGKDADYVAGCVQCHEEGVPGPRSTPGIDRIAVRGLTGVQVHPLPQDGACASCHVHLDRGFMPAAVVAGLGRVTAERVGYAGGAAFHGFADGGRATPSAQCLDCHWHQAGASKFRQQKDVSRLRDEARIRAAFGDSLAPLPGSGR